MGTFEVIACADPANQCHFVVPRHVLCVSPVLKGYIDEPDTTPPGVQRNGRGTITLNNDGDVVQAMLEYLRQVHCDENVTLQPNSRGTIFSVRLYKIALSLGLNDLCTITLRTLTSQVRRTDDFTTVALEASKWGLIHEEHFRRWFTRYISQRHDELLDTFNGDSDGLRLCRILITAVALVKDDHDQKDPRTPLKIPPATPVQVPRNAKHDSRSTFIKTTPSQSASKSKASPVSSTKKRRFNPTVEDAPHSE